MVAGQSDRERERTLLRQLVQRLPAAVVLLTRDGVVRRINQAAASILGVSVGYATGRPFPIFVDLAHRGAFRSHLAAVARGGARRGLRLTLAGQGGGREARLVLEQLVVPGEPDPAVMAV